MPNWKKVIVSGSDASLKSVYASNQSTFDAGITVNGTNSTLYNNVAFLDLNGISGSRIDLHGNNNINTITTNINDLSIRIPCGSAVFEVDKGSYEIYASQSIYLSSDVTSSANILISGSLLVGTSSFTQNNNERVLIDSGITDSFNLITARTNVNNYSQFNLTNKSSGVSASSDIVATNNIGTETTYFVDMGINGSNYINNGNGIGQANDAYLYTTGSNLLVGNITPGKDIKIFTSGGFVNINSNTTITGSLLATDSVIFSGSHDISNPTIKIYGDTQFDGGIKLTPVSDIIDTSISASYIFTSGSTNDLYFSQNSNGYNNVTRLRWLEGNLYSGLLNGGIIGTASSTVFTVSSGSGIIVNLNASLNDNPYPTIKYVKWNNLSSSISPLSASYDQTYVSIDQNSHIYTQGTPFIDGQYDTLIPVGIVLHQNRSTINNVKTIASVAYGWKQRSNTFIQAFGALKLSGFTIQTSGSAGIMVGSGTAFADGANYVLDPNNTSYITDSGTTVSKIWRYKQSGSAWVYDTNGGAGYTDFDQDYYNNPDTGVLTAMTNGQWSVQRLFWFPNSVAKAVVAYYGNAVYNSEAEARDNLNFERFNESPNTAANAIYLGAIAFRGDFVNWTDPNRYSIYPGGLFRNVGGSGGGGNISTTLLSGLSDVNITSPTNGQPLIYNNTSLKWENNSYISASISGNANTATTASYSINAISASYALSSSFSNKTILADSASYVLNAISSSFANNSQTASYVTSLNQNVTITGSLTATGDIITQGNIIAQQYIVSSSVAYFTESFSSGSTKFGNSLDDTHQFTGSVNITGSLNANLTGSVLGTGSYALSSLSSSYASSSFYAANANLATYASNIALLTDTTDTTLYPVFSGNIAANGYSTLRGNPSGALSYNATNFILTLSSGGIIAPSFTGSLSGTASYSTQALSSSYANNASTADLAINSTNSTSASYAITSSYSNKSSLSDSATNATSSSYANNASTANLASTASYVLNAISASYANNASTANNATSASYSITSSYSNKSSLSDNSTNATTASYVINAVSASYANNASTANTSLSSINALTASYVLNAISASYANNASTANLATTASYVINAISASYASSALSSSYAIRSTDSNNALTASYVSLAQTASNANFLDGYDSTDFARLAVVNRFTTNQIITGSLTTTGDIITQGNIVAQQYIISSSVSYFTESFSSGSTMFGNSLDDTHRFTGSIYVTNSLNINGTQTIVPTPGSGPLYVGLIISGSNTNGGTNYVDYLKPVNTAVGATNINKYYRLNSTGDIEIINSAYSSTIYSLSDSGNGYYAGGLGVGTASPTTPGLIRASNDVVSFYSSDERLKDNKVKINNALIKLDKINGYEFDWIPAPGIHENEGHDIGVIAQEIEAILPEIVTTRDNGYKAVKYEKIVPLLIQAIKELKTEIDSLKSGNYNKWD